MQLYKCLCLSEDAEVYVTIEGVKLKFVEKEDMKLLSLSLCSHKKNGWSPISFRFQPSPWAACGKVLLVAETQLMIWRMMITKDQGLFFCSPHMMIWILWYDGDDDEFLGAGWWGLLIHFKKTWLSQYIMVAKSHKSSNPISAFLGLSLWCRFCFRDKRFFFLFNSLKHPRNLINLDKSQLMSPIISLSLSLLSALQFEWVIWGGSWAQGNSILLWHGKGLKSSNRSSVRYLFWEFKGDISYRLQSRWFFH